MIIIRAILPNPVGTDSEGEWLVVENVSTSSVVGVPTDICSLKIVINENPGVNICNNEQLIGNGEKVYLAASPSIFISNQNVTSRVIKLPVNLLNSKTTVNLINPDGSNVTSVVYQNTSEGIVTIFNNDGKIDQELSSEEYFKLEKTSILPESLSVASPTPIFSNIISAKFSIQNLITKYQAASRFDWSQFNLVPVKSVSSVQYNQIYQEKNISLPLFQSELNSILNWGILFYLAALTGIIIISWEQYLQPGLMLLHQKFGRGYLH